jgi:hypothetical protein
LNWFRLIAALCLIPSFAWAACVATDQYSVAICADGPSHYYRLADSSGTTAVDNGLSPGNGTYNGGFTLSQTGALVSSSNTAVLYNGTTAYTAFPFDTDFQPSTTVGWSHEIWAKPTNDLTFAPFSGVGDATHAFYDVFFSGTGKFRARVFDNANSCDTIAAYGDTTGVGAYTAGTYYHIVLVTIGNGAGGLTSMKLYVNSVALATITSFTGTICGSSYVPEIGRVNVDGFAAVTLDEAAYYNYALSAAQVLAHYNAGITAINTKVFPFTVKRQPLRPWLPREWFVAMRTPR